MRELLEFVASLLNEKHLSHRCVLRACLQGQLSLRGKKNKPHPTVGMWLETDFYLVTLPFCSCNRFPSQRFCCAKQNFRCSCLSRYTWLHKASHCNKINGSGTCSTGSFCKCICESKIPSKYIMLISFFFFLPFAHFNKQT